jgi:hypothetical protein
MKNLVSSWEWIVPLRNQTRSDIGKPAWADVIEPIINFDLTARCDGGHSRIHAELRSVFPRLLVTAQHAS